MSTRVNIQVGRADLVDRVQRQQQQARSARLTREAATKEVEKNRPALLEASDAPTAPSRVDDTFSPTSQVVRPAAMRTATANIGHVLTKGEELPDSAGIPNPNVEIKLSTPNAEVQIITSLSFSRPLEGSGLLYNNEQFVLPCGSGNFILSENFNYAESFGGEPKQAYLAYVCSNAGIREISVPSAMRTVVDKFFLPIPTQLVLDYVEPVDFIYGSFRNSPAGYSLRTPDVYRYINYILAGTDRGNFVEQSLIKAFPANKRPVITDDRSGFYFTTTQEYPQELGNDTSIKYAYYTGPQLENPFNDQFFDTDPVERQQFYTFTIPKATVPNLVLPFGEPSNILNLYGLIAVWDWDDPAYCQSMCAALGFSDEDMVP